jgi:hypothetical protein
MIEDLWFADIDRGGIFEAGRCFLVVPKVTSKTNKLGSRQKLA